MTPYDSYKQAKTAGFFNTIGNVAKKVPDAVAQGLGATAATAAVTGMGFAAQKIYDAMTKRHDFNSMLEVNPDLADHHGVNPKMFNQMFSTLRTMNPSFSKDPVVAGTYMRRMMESPLHAGGIAVEALGYSKGPQGLLATSAIESGPAARGPFNPKEPRDPRTTRSPDQQNRQ